MYLDGQQYILGAVLDISRQTTAAKGRSDLNIVLSQRQAVTV